jgi:GNAT superfamily N-acetyltransferase
MGMAGMVKAFHGTPHKWEGDKFRMDKVGTGEGGQSYGYGGYFAENPKVAGLYQKAFSGEIELSNNSFVRFGDDEWTLAHTELRNAGGDFSKARASATNINEDFIRDAVIKELDTLETRGAKLTQANLYNIELDVNHEDLLDWDAPLSEQPQKIQDGVKTGMREHNWSEADIERVMKESNGQQALNYLMPSGNKAQASETLKNAGIPGIRYLDAGSRGAKEGTRNLVIFDEDLIKIADEAKNIDDFAANLEKKHGLSKLHLYERRDGSINLSQIEVPKANRKQGIGSGALQDIVDYADSQGKRVVLSTAQKFSGSTTSSARLKKFYKRFGFVENKGRNKDFTISDSMYREPK